MSRRSRVPAAFAVAVLTAVSAPVAQAAEEPTPPFDQVANCISFGRAIEPVSDAVSPGQRLVGQTQLWNSPRGAGVTVAIIDTGVNPGPAFGDRLRGGADLVVPDSATAGLQDCDGHGTLVAGLIGAAPDTTSGFAGVAPDVQLLSIRHNSLAFAQRHAHGRGRRGGGVAQAIDLAVSKGADVINISSAYCGPALTANDERLTAAVDRAVAADVVVVVAAGNLGTTAACSAQNMPGQAPVTGATPANIPSALTVGAVTAAGQPAEFSLAGSWVDLAAPGAKVISTNPHPTQSGQVGTVVGTEGDVEIQGTSFAAPYVTGIVALVRARFPRMPTAAQVVFRLQATADHPAGTGEQNIFVGHGIVNARRALTAVLPAEGGESAPAPTRAAALPAGPGARQRRAAGPSPSSARGTAPGGARRCRPGSLDPSSRGCLPQRHTDLTGGRLSW